MNKLNDEELSRALTAHELRGLKALQIGGCSIYGHPAYPGCLTQIAFEIDELEDSDRSDILGIALWFDYNYNANWTVEQFLVALEGVGLA
jgi:hypothetical protein